MAEYIESRQQEDGSWRTFKTWDGNNNPEEYLKPELESDVIIFKDNPIHFGCFMADDHNAKIHNVVDKNKNKQYVKAKHLNNCPSWHLPEFK